MKDTAGNSYAWYRVTTSRICPECTFTEADCCPVNVCPCKHVIRLPLPGGCPQGVSRKTAPTGNFPTGAATWNEKHSFVNNSESLTYIFFDNAPGQQNQQESRRPGYNVNIPQSTDRTGKRITAGACNHDKIEFRFCTEFRIITFIISISPVSENQEFIQFISSTVLQFIIVWIYFRPGREIQFFRQCSKIFIFFPFIIQCSPPLLLNRYMIGVFVLIVAYIHCAF